MSYGKTLFIKTNEDNYDLYENHNFFNSGDSGYDVFIPCDMTIPAHETVLVDLKIKCELRELTRKFFIGEQSDQLFITKPFLLCPRSSIYKSPLRMSNSIGIIDAGYRGSLGIPLDNISDKDYFIKRGTRLCQIVSGSLEPFHVKLTNDSLSSSERGSNGFGSTGEGSCRTPFNSPKN